MVYNLKIFRHMVSGPLFVLYVTSSLAKLRESLGLCTLGCGLEKFKLHFADISHLLLYLLVSVTIIQLNIISERRLYQSGKEDSKL